MTMVMGMDGTDSRSHQRTSTGVRKDYGWPQVARPVALGELEISVTPRRRLDPQTLEAFTAAGVHRLVINTVGSATPEVVEERLRAAIALIV